MTIGPIQAFVIGFPDNDLFEGRIADELARLSDVGQIRVVDAVFVMREGDDIAAVAVSDLDDDQRAELRSAVDALVGLGVAGADGADQHGQVAGDEQRRGGGARQQSNRSNVHVTHLDFSPFWTIRLRVSVPKGLYVKSDCED